MVSWIDVAQPACPDPVVAASLFKPNAVGCWELASLAALSDRQLLKATGSYFAERVLIAVTTVEVRAIDLGLLRVIGPGCRRWRREEIRARLVRNRDGGIALPAVSVARFSGWPCLELAPRDDLGDTMAVLESLLHLRRSDRTIPH